MVEYQDFTPAEPIQTRAQRPKPSLIDLVATHLNDDLAIAADHGRRDGVAIGLVGLDRGFSFRSRYPDVGTKEAAT